MTGDYEKRMQELKEIVRKIEDGSVGIDETIALYEKGTRLIRECERLLEEAELTISRLEQE
ncbi:MAG: exodeoxyribonuclease VII small subunit [Methanomicrobiales archaeon]|nr:exodeoxyribonuclease VII small subunit [Methanomicrobiales archaeon]